MTKKSDKIITYVQLQELGACEDQLYLFMYLFGDSVKLTKKLCISNSNKFKWGWAANNLLNEDAQTEYDKFNVVDRTEYKKICDAAWDEYYKAYDAAWDEYYKVCDVAIAKYKKICDAAWDEYYKVCDSAKKKYNKGCAVAFYNLYESK